MRDPAMEHFLSVLESEAVSVVQSILQSARAGEVPVLSLEQKNLWYLFFLMQWRRTPETQTASVSDAEAVGMAEEIMDELRAAAPHRSAEIEKLAAPEAMARLVRNVRVQTLIQFSTEMMTVLQRRGIAVLRIAKPNKSFVIGSRPVVRLGARAAHTHLSDTAVEMWLPIAADIAVGVGRGDGGISLLLAEDGSPVRQLNLAIARQSGIIAAGSADLVRSLANAR
jgi:hypothetical protein